MSLKDTLDDGEALTARHKVYVAVGVITFGVVWYLLDVISAFMLAMIAMFLAEVALELLARLVLFFHRR